MSKKDELEKTIEDEEDTQIDFTRVPTGKKPLLETAKTPNGVRNTSPIEVSSPVEQNDGEMSAKELEKERQRRKKLIAEVTSKKAHILDTVPQKLKCVLNPSNFCEETYCTNWKEIKGTKRCIKDYLAMIEAGIISK